MLSPWSCDPAQEGAGVGGLGCLTGHHGLCWAPQPECGMKAAVKKKILTGERRKLRRLNHTSRLFQVFHFDQAAILPDFCFEHVLEAELETVLVTCGKPKASAFEKQMNLVPD